MTKEETYQIRVSCSNCGYIQKKPVDIPKGISWYNHVHELRLACEYCGCKGEMNISCIGEQK